MKNMPEQMTSRLLLKISDDFRGVEERQIDQAIETLKGVKNVLGDKHALIRMDFDGRMESLV